MDKDYWLRRAKSSEAMAARAESSRARLIHLHLAGSYSVKAARCTPFLLASAASSPAERAALGDAGLSCVEPDAAYYTRLEEGAVYLAQSASDPIERTEHLNMARIYAGRACDAGVVI